MLVLPDRVAVVVVHYRVKGETSQLSIIIPVLNESEHIESHLNHLKLLRDTGHQVIVVDGGSKDNTAALAKPLCDVFITSHVGRSSQMNAGASHATGDYLLFLHADTRFPENLKTLMDVCTSNKDIWGRFDMRLSGASFWFRIIESCMNLRSRITGVATGDQAIFVSKNLFEKVNGFPDIPLMEDIAISKRLKKYSKPVCLKERVLSSSRRWEQNGILKTIIKMWCLRLLYFFNYDTHKLVRHY